MNTADIAALLYLVSGVLFILALKGLSSPATSQAGNRNGMIGMTIAVLATVLASLTACGTPGAGASSPVVGADPVLPAPQVVTPPAATADSPVEFAELPPAPESVALSTPGRSLCQ